MAIEKFIDKNFNTESEKWIKWCNDIIEEYQKQGLRLTLRQLHYQLVSRSLIINNELNYKKLSRVLSHGREAGRIDWDVIEDRGRQPYQPSEFRDLKHLAKVAMASYRLPRWGGQEFYCELWVEKDALAGVLLPMSEEYHVTLMVNKGYSSTSAMKEAAERFKGKQDGGKKCLLLYLGDHDPSGQDMIKDMGKRFQRYGADVEVELIALTTKQVKQYKCPPNFVKSDDKRAQKYTEKHGTSCWEVDALKPEVLQGIIKNAFKKYIDNTAMEKIKAQEEEDKKYLQQAVQHL